jgi:hypothetical protein
MFERPVGFARTCYVTSMTNKTATRPAKDKRRRTTSVPVTTMEDIPVLTDAERAALLASLKEAEAQIKAGDYTEYDRKKFRERFMRIYRGRKR